MQDYDLIIVGGGMAGLTSAIYAARYNIKALVISRELGGTTATAHKVCNFPSYFEISGFELMKKVREQVEKLGVPIALEEVLEIKKDKAGFIIKTSNNSYSSKKVIYAPGNLRRKLDIKGEKEFYGKGVSYCAVCDGPFFRYKVVAVVGGGNSALSAAILLAEKSKKVYIIYRKSEFSKAEPAWVEAVKKSKNIEIMFDTEVMEIKGLKKVNSVVLNNKKELKVDGIFIEIGSNPNPRAVDSLQLNTNNNYIVADKNQESNVKGFFVAGDVVDFEFKQAVVSAGHGAIATRAVYDSLKMEE